MQKGTYKKIKSTTKLSNRIIFKQCHKNIDVFAVC